MALVPQEITAKTSRDPFAHIGRFWDAKNSQHVAKLLPGEYYVTCEDEMITTVLGSCISACIRDPRAGIGGMNHFMLPHGDGRGPVAADSATRYGHFAMEHLINDILKLGGRRGQLEVKIFGGGKMIPAMADIGGRNIAFVTEFLTKEGYQIVSEDLGSVHPRKVNYFPKTGRVMMRKLRSMHSRVIAENEERYEHDLTTEKIGGDIELF